VRQVEKLLVVGVRVDRVHETVHDAETLMHYLVIGARQLVVQDAFEMMWCFAGRRCARSRRSRRSHRGSLRERR